MVQPQGHPPVNPAHACAAFRPQGQQGGAPPGGLPLQPDRERVALALRQAQPRGRDAQEPQGGPKDQRRPQVVAFALERDRRVRAVAGDQIHVALAGLAADQRLHDPYVLLLEFDPDAAAGVSSAPRAVGQPEPGSFQLLPHDPVGDAIPLLALPALDDHPVGQLQRGVDPDRQLPLNGRRPVSLEEVVEQPAQLRVIGGEAVVAQLELVVDAPHLDGRRVGGHGRRDELEDATLRLQQLESPQLLAGMSRHRKGAAGIQGSLFVERAEQLIQA